MAGGPDVWWSARADHTLTRVRIVSLITARLDELLPEPIEDVLERGEAQRRIVAEQLRDIG